MIKHLDHFVLFTKDMQKCLEFYEKLDLKSEKINDRYHLKAHTFGINIHEAGHIYTTQAEHPQIGSTFVAFEVEGTMNELLGFLENAGIPVVKGPVCRHGYYGQGTSVYIKDPDGNIIELISYKAEDIDKGD